MPPFKSQKQAAFFNANKDELEKKGVDVDQWNEESKGKKLPAKAPAPKNKPTKSRSLGAASSITKL